MTTTAARPCRSSSPDAAITHRPSPSRPDTREITDGATFQVDLYLNAGPLTGAPDAPIGARCR
jgi:hypothetical protein